MRIDGEDVDKFEERGDHTRAEQALRDQVRVVGVPFFPKQNRRKNNEKPLAVSSMMSVHEKSKMQPVPKNENVSKYLLCL